MTNGIRKVRKGVDIFDKKILLILSSSWTHYFSIPPHLQQSFPCSLQNIKLYHNAWCTTYQDSTLFVSIFLVSGKREGEEEERNCMYKMFFFLTVVGVCRS